MRKTNRVIVAYEDSLSWGYGAEIAARIADELFAYLDAPVRRVASTDTFVAYAPELEDVILPQVDDLQEAMLEIARYESAPESSSAALTARRSSAPASRRHLRPARQAAASYPRAKRRGGRRRGTRARPPRGAARSRSARPGPRRRHLPGVAGEVPRADRQGRRRPAGTAGHARVAGQEQQVFEEAGGGQGLQDRR